MERESNDDARVSMPDVIASGKQQEGRVSRDPSIFSPSEEYCIRGWANRLSIKTKILEDYDSLRECYRIAYTEIMRLRNENASLQSQVEHKQGLANEQAVAQFQGEARSGTGNASEREALSMRYQQAEQELRDERARFAQQQSIMSDLQSNLQKSQQETVQTKRDLQQCRIEIDNLNLNAANLQSELDSARSEVAQLESELRDKEDQILGLEEELDKLYSQLDEVNSDLDRQADKRLRTRQVVVDAEFDRKLAEERASFGSGLKEFQALDEGIREAFRNETHATKREINKIMHNAIEQFKSAKEEMQQHLSDYISDLYLHDFDGLAMYIQYYFKSLMHMRSVSGGSPENDELAKTLAEFEGLGVTLENACGEMGLSFVWASAGQPFKAGTEHDLLDENDVPTGVEGVELIVQKCVAPGITQKKREGREKTIRRPIVTVKKGGKDEQ